MKEYKISLANKNRSVIKNIYKKLSADKVNALSIIRTIGASQKFGNGYVIVFGDGNVAYGCRGGINGGNYSNINDKFWSNVNHFASMYNSGLWGMWGLRSSVFVPYNPALTPTINLSTDIDQLSVLGGLWVGMLNGCGSNLMVPQTHWSRIRSWIQSGGIFVMIGEFPGCDYSFYSVANIFLEYMRSSISIDSTEAVLSYCVDSRRNEVDNTNIFINGSSYGGQVVAQLNFAATAYVNINTNILPSAVATDPNLQCFVDCCFGGETASRIAYCNGPCPRGY